MLSFLFDTDHLTLYEHSHPTVCRRLGSQPRYLVGISDVTAEEAIRGRLAAVSRARDGATRIQRYAQLRGTLHLLQQFEVVPYGQVVEDEFQRLLAMRLRIGA